ncbi:hypothetical protein L195_g063871, partial [Trifolium pratense]
RNRSLRLARSQCPTSVVRYGSSGLRSANRFATDRYGSLRLAKPP